jgi:hypothetical protein
LWIAEDDFEVAPPIEKVRFAEDSSLEEAVLS